MHATVINLRRINPGDTIVVADDPTDSYTKVPSGRYKGMFESHLYFGELYSTQMLSEILEDVDCYVVSAH